MHEGFVANYPRRLPTTQEKIDQICLDKFAPWVVKEVFKQHRAYLYFKGWPHRQLFPKRWGAGDNL